jgi:thiol:disulfide interchange protein
MKNIIGIFILISLFLGSCSRKTVNNFKLPEIQELDEILAKSQAENKPVFIDVYAPWCGPCKWMDQNTFSNPEVQNYLTQNFVSTKVDAESFEGVNITLKYKINSLPTYLFIDSKGNVLNRIEGMMQAEAFIREAEYALDLKKSR